MVWDNFFSCRVFNCFSVWVKNDYRLLGLLLMFLIFLVVDNIVLFIDLFVGIKM